MPGPKGAGVVLSVWLESLPWALAKSCEGAGYKKAISAQLSTKTRDLSGTEATSCLRAIQPSHCGQEGLNLELSMSPLQPQEQEGHKDSRGHHWQSGIAFRFSVRIMHPEPLTRSSVGLQKAV